MPVTLDRSRDLEGRRAKQSNSSADRSVERDHDFRCQQAIVARPSLRRIRDVVSEEISGSDGDPRHPQGGTRVFGIDHRQPVGNDRSPANRAEVGNCRGLPHHRSWTLSACTLTEVISKTAQIVDDERAVPEQLREELDIGQPGDRVADPVMQAVQGIHLVRRDEQIEHSGNGQDEQQTKQYAAPEEQQRNYHRVEVELARADRNLPGVERMVTDGTAASSISTPPWANGIAMKNTLSNVRHGGAGAADAAAAGRRHPLVVDRRASRRRSVPSFAGRHRHAAVQRRCVPELRPVAHGGVDVEDGFLTDVHIPAEGDRAGLNPTGVRSVSLEEGLLADDRARPDGQQVGAYRHVLGQND